MNINGLFFSPSSEMVVIPPREAPLGRVGKPVMCECLENLHFNGGSSKF